MTDRCGSGSRLNASRNSAWVVEAEPQPTVPPQSENEGQTAATVTLTPVVIAQFAHEADVRFFQDQHGNVFAWVLVQAGGKEHFECLGIKSRTFLARLLELIKQRTELMPQLSVLKQAIEILQLEAYRAPKQKLDIGPENQRTDERLLGSADGRFVAGGKPEFTRSWKSRRRCRRTIPKRTFRCCRHSRLCCWRRLSISEPAGSSSLNPFNRSWDAGFVTHGLKVTGWGESSVASAKLRESSWRKGTRRLDDLRSTHRLTICDDPVVSNSGKPVFPRW